MIQSVLSFVSGVGEWMLGLLIGDYFLINSYLGSCLLFQESFCTDYRSFLRSFTTWTRNSIGPPESLFSHRFSNQYSNPKFIKNRIDFFQVFTCRHNQHWKAACLISLAFLLISVNNEQNDCTVFNIFAICIIWSLLRMFGILDNSVDDLDIFSKCN